MMFSKCVTILGTNFFALLCSSLCTSYLEVASNLKLGAYFSLCCFVLVEDPDAGAMVSSYARIVSTEKSLSLGS